jgi:release factor glutamine methyltransferase
VNFPDVGALLSEAASRLQAAGVESPRREARLLLAHALGVRQEDIIAGQPGDLTSPKLAKFEGALVRRIAREPLAYIVGSREFWSLKFAVGPGVLVPRPESEILIAEAFRRFPADDRALRVLDLGTGSGCLLLTFLSERPHASGVGIDISQDALAFAWSNAKSLAVEQRAEFKRGDWLDGLSGVFDVIFINPPYVRRGDLQTLEPEIERYEPRGALDGGPDGIDAYRRIAAGLPNHMHPQSRAFVEVGQGQAGPGAEVFAQAELIVEGTVCDLAGIPRCLVVRRNVPKA